MRSPSNTLRSPMVMVPDFGLSSPATARSSVVLPLPDGPSSATTSPRCRSIDTPFKMALAVAPVP